METESLFTSTRWDILSALSRKKMSPLELAAEMKTTSANVSQQLRLLELAGLVKSEKTSNVDKGKPRILYSLAGDTSLIILASSNFSEKKLLPLGKYHNFILRAMFVEDTSKHSALGELYFALLESLGEIKIVAFSASQGDAIIVAESAKSKESIKKAISNYKKVRVSFQELEKFSKSHSKDTIVLYDPENIFSAEVKKNGRTD